MRAVEAVQAGRLRVAGFELAYEVFGEADAHAPALLLLPSWQIAPSRHWRMQIAHLSRFRRVIAFDPPGIGGGERTTDPAAYQLDRVVDYGIGLLDHLGVSSADVLGLSMGGLYGLWTAARHPERVTRLVLLGSTTPERAFTPDPGFWELREHYEGWEKRNGHFWREHYDDWLAFFFAQVCSEPHSTKPTEDFVGWARKTTPEVLIASIIGRERSPQLNLEEAVARISCPVLLLHGTADQVADIAFTRTLAERRPDWECLELEGCGHGFHARDPVRTNLELGRFLGFASAPRRTFRRAMTRPGPRALLISSAIGLGHVHRDLAIARELRRIVPGLEIDWLTQPPVIAVLEAAGEHVHPLSGRLASESAHWEHSSRHHRLHCFHAWREMDEILLANFMIFLEAVRETPYDLWIGDEAWDVDYYLHENPELKSAPYVFITDFIGWLPIDRSPGSREATLTADHNAEMLEQVERYPRVRDRALYVGGFDDLVDERFGPGLPRIGEWAREHFDAVGYVLPSDPPDHADTAALRERLGYEPGRPLVVCTVGGTATGEDLLKAAVAAWPVIARERPDAHCVAVCGPRIDPRSLPSHPDLEVRAYVHDLCEHLAAADLAIVQGGLATTMELTASRRPFLYFPLADHCEQVFHVAHRLDRHGAGRRLEFASTDSWSLAAAALETLDSDTAGYRCVDPGAGARAARLIAELV